MLSIPCHCSDQIPGRNILWWGGFILFWFLVPETLVHCAQEAVIGPAVFIMVDQKQKRIPKPQPSSISFNPIWAPDFIDGASHISSWSFLAQFILSGKTPTDTEKVICVFFIPIKLIIQIYHCTTQTNQTSRSL